MRLEETIMADEKKVTETETETKSDFFGNPKSRSRRPPKRK